MQPVEKLTDWKCTATSEGLADALIAKAKENPYFHLTDRETGEVYMERYWLRKPDEKGGNGIRIHHTMRSDMDRALHDHPWPSTSIILKGGFFEILPRNQGQNPSMDAVEFDRIWRAPGDVVSRSASDRHRLEIPDGQSCWTMFVMGEWEKDWGFYDVENHFVYWREYLNDYTTVTASDSKTMV